MSHRSDSNMGHETCGRRLEACSAWALLLVDAAEGLLSEGEQSVLDRHVASCSGCAQELADAQLGAAWLGLFKGHTPEPSSALLSNILAKTTGTAAFTTSSASLSDPAAAEKWPTPAPPLPVHGRSPHQVSAWSAHGTRPGKGFSHWPGTSGSYVPALQPRLAMTSAMAFFSICLTLNLLGFSLHNLRAEALRPAGIQRTVSDTSASLVRSFEGIRMVYRVESRVNEWRTASAPGNDAPLENNQ